MTARIHHIVTGELEAPLDNSLLNSGLDPTVPQEERLPFGFRRDLVERDGSIHEGLLVPVPVWLIDGLDQKILVDTGLGDVDEVWELLNRYGDQMISQRTGDQGLLPGLAAHGLTPADIDIVIMSHLHFDHVGNTDLFPNATFIVQKDELPQALNPPRYHMFYFPEYVYKIKAMEGRMRVIDGDLQLNDSVRLVKLGGHTPGTMVVMVETAEGTVCIAADAAYNYKNLELDWPTGSFWNLKEMVAGFERMKSEADIVIPGHDWQFREIYPSGTVG